MRRFLLLLLAVPLWGQTVDTDFKPSTTGRNLGSPNQQWNVFAQDVDVYRAFRIHVSAPIANPNKYFTFKVDYSAGIVLCTKSDGSACAFSGSAATYSPLPSGGTTGQCLAKNSNTDYDTGWTACGTGGGGVTTTNLAGLPAAGTGTEGSLFNLTDGMKGLYWYKGGYAHTMTGSINVQDWQVKGDDSTDDTTNFAAIFSAIRSTGGRVIVPPGMTIKLTSAVQIASGPGQSVNRVTLECLGGYNASRFKWYGTNQSAMLVIGDTTNYGAVTVKGCGFMGSDSSHKPIAISINDTAGNSVSVGIEANYFGSNVYRAVRGANTWLGWIQHNRFYTGETYVEFGGGSNTGPVNAYNVNFNEFGAGFTGNAIYTHTNNASYGNVYGPNSVENDNTPFGNAMDLADNSSTINGGYWEITDQAGVYDLVIRGSLNKINLAQAVCMQITGANNSVSVGAATGTCLGQTYIVKNDNSSNRFYGFALNSQIGGTGTVAANYGSDLYAAGGTIKAYALAAGTANDWPGGGRIDISNVPMANSNSNEANPSAPSQFGTAAVVPQGTIVWNRYAWTFPSKAIDANIGWVCAVSTCATNPINPLQWRRFGEISDRVFADGTAAPTTSNWRAGDYIKNTNPATGIIGWLCTVGGTPGTWIAVQAWQTGTTSGTVAAGDDSRITSAVPNTRTVNGKALSGNITLGLASADFANQGTTTTVLHGNAAGNPSFGGIVIGDITDKLGTGTKVATTSATAPAGNKCVEFDTNGNLVVAGSNAACGSGGTASGSDTQVQFNDGGTAFGGDAGMTYNKTTDILTVGGVTTAGTPGGITLTEIAAPASPSAGSLAIYADSTAHRFNDKNSSGVIGTTVVGAASRTANQFVTNIKSADGTQEKASIATADLPAGNNVRVCELIVWGTGASNVLQDTDDWASDCKNKFGVTWTITAVECYADAGSPTFMLTVNGGSNVLSGNLTCGTASWAAGSLSGTPTVASNGSLDFTVVSAGGTAHYIRVLVAGTI